jgi:hypothetical protein
MNQAVVYCQLRHNLHPCFWDSLRQTRRLWSGDIYLVAPQRESMYTAIKKYDVKFVSEESLTGKDISEYEKTTFLDYPGWDGFWDLSCKRFFYESKLMEQGNIDSAILIETDVALYAPVADLFDDMKSPGISFIDHCPEQLSCSYRVVNNKENLKSLCSYVMYCFKKGTEWVRQQAPTQDIINETTLAYLFRSIYNQAPLLPNMPMKDHKYVYDPMAYGQWIGGRHHNPGVPYADKKHYVGAGLLDGSLKIEWDYNDAGHPRPLVNGVPLACLHFNGKQIAQWI